jgi:hypothetical protein
MEEKREDCDDDDIDEDDDVEAQAPPALPEVRAFAETSKSYSVVADVTEVIPLDVVEEQHPAAAAAGYCTTTNHYQYHNNHKSMYGGDGDIQIEATPLSSSSLSTKPYCSSVELWTNPTTRTTATTSSTTSTTTSVYITMIVTSPFLNSPNRNFTFLHHLGKFNFDLAPPNPIPPFYFSDSLSHASADSFLF